jgi:hypothetical protein
VARPQIVNVRAHWAQLIENLEASPQGFYASIEKAIQEREMPDAKISRKLWPEGGIFSARREYLRVQRRRHTIDICGAPFGSGFFSSSWLIPARPSILVGVILVLIGLAVLGWAFSYSDIGGYIVGGRWIHMDEIQKAAAIEIVLAGVFGIIRPLFFPPRFTYYRHDTAQMFYLAVHKAVGEVIDGLCTAQGVRLLTEDERKPIMRLFDR